jgi:hypothetical protein
MMLVPDTRKDQPANSVIAMLSRPLVTPAVGPHYYLLAPGHQVHPLSSTTNWHHFTDLFLSCSCYISLQNAVKMLKFHQLVSKYAPSMWTSIRLSKSLDAMLTSTNSCHVPLTAVTIDPAAGEKVFPLIASDGVLD